MSNGNDSKFRSRKWIIAILSFIVVTLFAAFGIVFEADGAKDISLIIGAWAASDLTILGVYTAGNVAQGRSGK